jgi:hypothetical protein
MIRAPKPRLCAASVKSTAKSRHEAQPSEAQDGLAHGEGEHRAVASPFRDRAATVNQVAR